MSEFHDDYPQYELMAHHSEEDGKKKRRKLWNVFWIMLIITLVELVIGFYAAEMGLLNEDRTSGLLLKFIFITLTIAKAFYIVYKFMHLGDEKKALKYTIIAPYTIFIVYFIILMIIEANYNKGVKDRMDQLIVTQKEELNRQAKEGGHHGGGEHHEGQNTEHH